MKRFYLLLVLIAPVALFGQIKFEGGAITIDPFAKKKKAEQQDSIKASQGTGDTPPATYQEEQGDTPPQKAKSAPATGESTDEARPVNAKKQAKRQQAEQEEETTEVVEVDENEEKKKDVKRGEPDFKDGVFKGIFHVGVNACQIDGDRYGGYKYAGLDAGVGVMVKFHPIMSASLEINYSMKGARQAYQFQQAPQTLQMYRTQCDYMEVPLTFNVHDPRRYVMFSLGVSAGYMIRFTQRDEQGQDLTNNPAIPFNKNYDIEGIAALHGFIQGRYGLGLKFGYSLVKLGGSSAYARANGLYNNVLTVRFTYLLDPVKKKKK